MGENEFKYAESDAAVAFQNKTAITCYTLMMFVITVAYLFEVLKGARTIVDFSINAVGCIATAAASIIMYRKQNHTKSVRYIISYGFAAIYAYLVFGSNTNLVFCYIMLIMTLTILYSDVKLTLISSILAFITNVAYVVMNVVQGVEDKAIIAEYEIMIAAIAIMGFYAIKVSGTIQRISEDRYGSMNAKNKRVEELLDTTFSVSNTIIDNVKLATEEINKLDTSISATKSSMEDVVTGVNETTESVQTQQLRTEEIGTSIEEVAKITDVITADVAEAEKLVNNGKDFMDDLIKQVNSSQDVSKLVAGEMETLQENANNMQNILSLINNVATQTGLLALNASIEAARAGEAGKGFAVVAGEISNLANQTKDATGNINELIASIETSLLEVTKSVNELIENNNKQGEFVEKTADNFEKINDSTNNIYSQSKDLSDMVGKLGKANDAIIESIQNISAVSEEMTARANETLESSQEDTKSVGNVASIIEVLNNSAKELEEQTHAE